MKPNAQTLFGLLGVCILVTSTAISGCGKAGTSVRDATETSPVDSTRDDAAFREVGDTEWVGDTRLDVANEADSSAGLSADACGQLVPPQLSTNPPSSASPCFGPVNHDPFNCPYNRREPGLMNWDESWVPYSYLAENFFCGGANEVCVWSEKGSFSCAGILSQLTGDLDHDTALMPGRCYSRCAIPCPVTDANMLWAKTTLVLGEKCGEPDYHHEECWDEGVEEQEMQDAEFTDKQICDRARSFNCWGWGATSSCAPGDSCIAKLLWIFYWDRKFPEALGKWAGVCVPAED